MLIGSSDGRASPFGSGLSELRQERRATNSALQAQPARQELDKGFKVRKPCWAFAKPSLSAFAHASSGVGNFVACCERAAENRLLSIL